MIQKNLNQNAKIFVTETANTLGKPIYTQTLEIFLIISIYSPFYFLTLKICYTTYFFINYLWLLNNLEEK